MKYMIDGDDRIIFVDGTWSLCRAQISGSGEGGEEQMLGRSLWSLVESLEARQILSLLIGRARTGARIEIGLGAEGSESERLLICSPLSGYVVFEVTSKEEGKILSLSAAQDGGGERLEICSWCGRVKMADAEWVEIEEAVSRLRLYQKESLPQLTHGICECCYRDMSGQNWEARREVGASVA